MGVAGVERLIRRVKTRGDPLSAGADCGMGRTGSPPLQRQRP